MTRVRGSQGTHRNGHPALQLVSPDQEQCNTVQYSTCTHCNHHPEPRNCSHSSKRGYSYSLEARTQLQKSNWSKVPKAHIAKKNGTAHTLQKRTAQGTHRNDHPEPCNCSPIGRQWPNGQLAAGGKNQLRLLWKNIHFSAVLHGGGFFWAIF